MNIPCILIPVLVGLICGILGYLLWKMNSKGDGSLAADLQADLDACKAHTKSLNTRISALEADLAVKLSTSKTTQSFAASTTPVFLFDQDLAASVCNKKIEENDLKIVEGIGPKIETLMNAAGISTWKELSEASTEKLQAILDAGGENFAIHNPSTWAKQALLAYEGKWQDLKDLQENLMGGKE